MKVLLGELESLTLLPAITDVNAEVANYLRVVNQQQEEQMLFEFLNGLDEVYGQQRSQILLMSPLPHEENQREIFKPSSEEAGGMAMYSKKSDMSCTNCGKIGHTVERCWACKACGKPRYSYEKCWTVVGYPSGHDKGKMKEGAGKKFFEKEKGSYRDGRKGGQKWNKGRKEMKRSAGNVKVETEGSGSSSANSAVTVQQLEQLLKLLPTLTKGNENETNEELEHNYSRMVSCNSVTAGEKMWIVDSGATHHMTGEIEKVKDVVNVDNKTKINLPIGETLGITGMGTVRLGNGMRLKNVMIIPAFKQSLFSVKKLTEEENCKVVFWPHCCIIQDEKTSKVRGVGKAEKGLYYLQEGIVDELLKQCHDSRWKAESSTESRQCQENECNYLMAYET
ncbi:Retrovirus-related Pol polyprotein from transposon RE1 [Bienertia sinuspersici]